MSDRLDRVKAMKRIELARLHASELNRALFPDERHDDDISGDEKQEIQLTVSEVVAQHRAEVSAWEEANG